MPTPGVRRSFQAPRRRRALAFGLAAAMLLAGPAAMFAAAPSPAGEEARIPIAVIGDSDSHAYQDKVGLPDKAARGGAYRATTLQWTEILVRLRGTEIDLGDWGLRGTPGRIAKMLWALGLDVRSPRREDYGHVFAVSGAGCDDLLAGWRLTPQLVRAMREAPERWRRGLVVIRIGINSLGGPAELDRFGATGLDAEAKARAGLCAGAIEQSVRRIRAEHPQTAIVVASNVDDNFLPVENAAWLAEPARSNIRQVFDWYEQALRAVCERAGRSVFISYRPWFKSIWGMPAADGSVAYRAVHVGGPVGVVYGLGDAPRFTSVADGHSGTVVNGLWARDLVLLMRERFHFDVRPIGDDEVARLADPTGEYGIRGRGEPGR